MALVPGPPTQFSITVQQRGREPGNILQVSHVGREEVEERVCGSSRTAKKREATFTLLPVQVHTHTNKVSRSTPLYPWRCSRDMLWYDAVMWQKYQALPTCTTAMSVFQSMRAWEQGYIIFFSWLVGSIMEPSKNLCSKVNTIRRSTLGELKPCL